MWLINTLSKVQIISQLAGSISFDHEPPSGLRRFSVKIEWEGNSLCGLKHQMIPFLYKGSWVNNGTPAVLLGSIGSCTALRMWTSDSRGGFESSVFDGWSGQRQQGKGFYTDRVNRFLFIFHVLLTTSSTLKFDKSWADTVIYSYVISNFMCSLS